MKPKETTLPNGMAATKYYSPTQSEIHTLTDEQLLRLVAQQKNEGLDELVRRYNVPIYRFLARYLTPAQDIEQATLNVFIRAWQHAPRFQFRAQVSTWLYRIAINIAHDIHSSPQSRHTTFEPEHLNHSSLIGNVENDAMRRLDFDDKYQQLQQALQKLSETDRMLLVLYYFEEANYDEMQAISGFSYKVLKTRLSRARQRLRTLLEEADEKQI